MLVGYKDFLPLKRRKNSKRGSEKSKANDTNLDGGLLLVLVDFHAHLLYVAVFFIVVAHYQHRERRGAALAQLFLLSIAAIY